MRISSDIKILYFDDYLDYLTIINFNFELKGKKIKYGSDFIICMKRVRELYAFYPRHNRILNGMNGLINLIMLIIIKIVRSHGKRNSVQYIFFLSRFVKLLKRERNFR